jgi:uncharacterized glyoxalase superfamily protein PhnB
MPHINRVIALLVYEDIAAAHDFLVAAFGFESGGLHRDAAGRVVHGEVRAGEFAIWLHRVTAEHCLATPKSLPANSSGLVIQVDDVDAHYEYARTHGADVEKPPEDRPYGQREYGVADLEGHRWWFASPLKH